MPTHSHSLSAEIAPDWFWRTNPDGCLSELQACSGAVLGRPDRDLLGRTLDDLCISSRASDLDLYRHALVQRRAFFDLPLTFTGPDGRMGHIALSGGPLNAGDGGFLGFSGIGRLIVQQPDGWGPERQAEALTYARLMERNRCFDAALENMTQGLCMFDGESRLLIWNRRYLAIFGLDASDLAIGMHQREIIARLIACGRYKPGATVEALSEGTRRSLLGDGQRAILRELSDGRVIAAMHRPMAGGGWITTFEDVTERHRNAARIVHMARHDPLTDLQNRSALRETGAALLAKAMSAQELSGRQPSMALLCLDLARFRLINDTYGHPTGDGLLRMVADRLRAMIPSSDLVARLGGDEFAILYRTPTGEDAGAMARQVLTALRAPYALDLAIVEIDACVGLATLEHARCDIDELLSHAGNALDHAKTAGPGTVRAFEPAMDQAARARCQLERALREAIARDEFELHYQPLVTLHADAKDRISGVEALVRWRHPQRGLVSPATFIPLAEETGLIVPLGDWVLQQACRDAAGWSEPISLAVNVSPLQLRSPGFVHRVAAALAASGLSAMQLELEITESVLLDDTEANLDTLHGLRDLGVRISMDDFGTGYSSISYLRRFPFDKIKIDRSFVRDLGSSTDAATIVHAIVGLGVNLGITTLVEGIETGHQLDLVRAAGAQQVQGYWFSPPRPAAEITTMLGASGTPARAA